MMGSMASQGQQQELLCVEYKNNNYSSDWLIQESHPVSCTARARVTRTDTQAGQTPQGLGINKHGALSPLTFKAPYSDKGF